MAGQDDPETEVVGELEVEEVACEDHAAEHADGLETETELSADEESALDSALEGESVAGERAAGGLGPPGGGWCGSQAPVQRAMRIGSRNGLRITSTKRSSGSSGSDHHTSQRCSFAADMSNGSAPTPEMDRTAQQIARLLGYPNWRGGVLTVRQNGYRVQLLWRTNVGGNHFNHVHVGVRVR